MGSTSSDATASNADSTQCCNCGCQPPDQTCDPPNTPHNPSDYSDDPIRYSNGEILLVETDLSFTSFGIQWGHTRSYGNRVTDPASGRNGNSWFVKEWPYLVAQGGEIPSPEPPPTIALTWLITETLWFDLDPATGEYVARFFVRPKLIYDSASDTYTLVEANGRRTKFFGFNNGRAALRGQFLSYTDPSGRETLAHYGSSDLLESFVQTAAGQHTGYYYEYITSGGNRDKLHRVTYKVNGRAVRRAEYQYYGASDAHGSLGDLKKVTVARYSGSAWTTLTNRYYRYYKEGQRNGVVHGLRFAVGPLGYQRMVEHHITPEIARNDQIAAYATNQFKYHPDRSVVGEIVNSGSVTFGFTRTPNPVPPPAQDFNAWALKTTEARPDGSTRTVYTNFAGQAIFTVYSATPPGALEPEQWYGWKRYDGAGRTLQEASSSAIAGFDESRRDLALLHENRGLIRSYEFYPATGFGAGGAPNYKRSEFVQQGSGGPPIRLKEWKYVRRRVGGSSVYKLASETIFHDESGGGSAPATTRYSYRWQHFQVRELTTTYPIVSEAENGTGSSESTIEAYDAFGRLSWRRDERGFINGYNYDPATDALIQQILDVSGGAPWPVLPGAHLALVTDFQVDDEGRRVQELGPPHEIDSGGAVTLIRRAKWTVYQDDLFQEWNASGFLRVEEGTYELINPVSISARDELGRPTDEIQAIRPATAGPLQPSDEFPQTTWCRWLHYDYTYSPQVGARREFFKIPETGFGERNGNYNETQYSYDVMQRLIATVSPSGTITRLVLHPQGWVLSEWVGTDDSGATESDPTGGGAPDNNMVLVRLCEYDDLAPGGDGNLTRSEDWVTAAEVRETTYEYDFRNRLTGRRTPMEVWEGETWDNADHRVGSERRRSDATGQLIARTRSPVDARGRIYQHQRWDVDQSTGVVGEALAVDYWFDPAGNLAAYRPEGCVATFQWQYDGGNRQVLQLFILAPLSPFVFDPATDVVIEQIEKTFDPAGNEVFVTNRSRAMDATGAGLLGEADGPQPRARVTYTANWPDALGRLVNVADYGTNDEEPPIRPPLPPNRSDTILVRTSHFSLRGELWRYIDPMGRSEEATFDDQGRVVSFTYNAVAGGSGADENNTLLASYAPDGGLASLTARNPVTGDQTTEWLYGTTLEDSALASNSLVRAKVQPDPATGDLAISYNRQGRVATLRDGRGTMHEYEYDLRGRLMADAVIALGSGVDGAIRRLEYEYDGRDLLVAARSYREATGSPAAIANEISYSLDGFGDPMREWQAHAGAVGSGTPSIGYESLGGGELNSNRMRAMIYPDGRRLAIGYGEPRSIDDQLSRLREITEEATGTVLANYEYIGKIVRARTTYPEPAISLSYASSGGGADPGYDRFGRIRRQSWKRMSSGAPVDSYEYGFDRHGSRLYRRNEVAVSGWDELYTYDGLNRLLSLERGTLDGAREQLEGPSVWAERFTLDATGNWLRYRQSDAGGELLDQTRTHNRINQITSITPTGLFGYDAAGNTMQAPVPGQWSAGAQFTWDAWNRLVRVASAAPGESTDYAYDALHRRVRAVGETTGGSRDFYYSREWRIVETRDGDGSVLEQYVWRPGYQDELVLSYRGGERIYALSDPQNITAMIDASGSVVERFAYAAYGAPLQLSPEFEPAGLPARSAPLFGHYFFDAESALYQVRHRSLHSGLGRWLSLDPLQEEAGLNLYDYVEDNPINHLDPFGLINCPCQGINIVLCRAFCFLKGGVRSCHEGNFLVVCICNMARGFIPPSKNGRIPPPPQPRDPNIPPPPPPRPPSGKN